MSYLVYCTFDLKNATARDYTTAYAELSRLGLEKVHKSDNGKDVVIPTTSAMGTYNGASAAAVRDHVREEIKKAFAARGLRSEIFVVVGGNWAWGPTTT